MEALGIIGIILLSIFLWFCVGTLVIAMTFCIFDDDPKGYFANDDFGPIIMLIFWPIVLIFVIIAVVFELMSMGWKFCFPEKITGPISLMFVILTALYDRCQAVKQKFKDRIQED